MRVQVPGAHRCVLGRCGRLAILAACLCLFSGVADGHAQSLNVALICGTAACADANRDVPMRNHLTTTLGHAVTTFNDNDQTWVPTNFDVVVISESVLSSATAWLKNQAVPILTVEGANSDELEMGSGGSSAGGADTDIDITDNSHYITGVFPTGVRTVTTVTTNLGYMTGWANGIRKLAHYSSNATRAKLLAVDAAGLLRGGVNTATARRVFFGVRYFANLTADGITLFDRSLNWAAGNTADHIIVTATDGAATAGGTEVLSLQLVDDLGNPVSSTSSVDVTVTGSATFGATDLGGTNGSSTVTGVLSATGSGSVTITDNAAETVTVSADATGDAQVLANVDDVVIFTARTPDGSTSTITANPTSLSADGVTPSTVTVQLKDASGGDLTLGGDVVVLTTSVGTLSAVVDNADGTYSATLTSATDGAARVTGTVNGAAIADDAVVVFSGAMVDLDVRKTVSEPQAREGETVVYTITVTNQGPGTATGVQITDELPGRLSCDSASASQGSVTGEGQIVWNVGTLAKGNGATLTLTCSVTSEFGA